MDVRSTQFEEKRINRLIIAIGHGLLVPEVSESRAHDAVAKGHDKYLSVAGPPFPLSHKPGVIITTAARGKSVDLTHVVERIGCAHVVNVPYEMLAYIRTHKPATAGAIEQMMKDMRNLHKSYQFFNHDTEFAIRLPGSMMENTVLWAEGSRIIYGGVWMIDLSSPTDLLNVSKEFGLVERDSSELQPVYVPTSTDREAMLVESALMKECSSGCKKMSRELHDLRLCEYNCLGELRREDDQPITLKHFLERGQHFFREDDALILVSCRNFAKYADHLQGSASPESSPRLTKRFGGKKSKRTRKNCKKRYNKKTRFRNHKIKNNSRYG